MASIQKVSKQDFDEATAHYTCVSSGSLGAEVLGYSDQWFAEATNLIKPGPPVYEVRFVPSGRWYDGWETRRHNTEPSDWVVIKLGVNSAKILGVEVDTAYFNGNHAPAISVEGSNDEGKTWHEIIAKHECGPSQPHYFLRTEGLTSEAYSHLKLHMYPDGGIARFRAYGEPVPVFPKDKEEEIDMAAITNGGVTIAVSDQHFSSADNLLLPGRGIDMSDGWETSRSRVPGHTDWAIVKLGAPTLISEITVDTAFFRGNFPQSIKVLALNAASNDEAKAASDEKWVEIVGQSKTSADQEHRYTVEYQQPATHVKLVMIPDGGIKRLRVIGKRA